MKKARFTDSQIMSILKQAEAGTPVAERYNRTVRYDRLGQHLFTSLDELQNYATGWQWFYNHERPNMALNGYTPMQHIQRMA